MSDCGIYAIRNKVNDKCYIGSSCRLRRRMADHRGALRRGTHVNVKLQRAWDLYGEASFVFEVVELCPRADLLRVEQQHIDTKDTYRTGYNCKPYTTTQPEERFTPEVRARISAAAKTRVMPKRGPMSDEVKEKIRSTKLGKTLTEAHRKKLSEAKKGHTVSQKAIDALVARNKASAGHPLTENQLRQRSLAMLGRTHSAETKRKMAEARAKFWANKREEAA